MAARSIGSGTISFGMVTIPFKIYTAVSPKSVSFNMLHRDCGSRLKQILVCPAHENAVVDRKDTIRGFEYSKDQFVSFDDEEIKSLESTRSNVLTLEEFVPAETVDFLFIEKTYFIGPDKGDARAYAMLAVTLERNRRFAVGRFAQRGKDHLVIVRPYKGGLVLHQAYYADEVNAFEEIELGGQFAFKPMEYELADKLIEQLDRPRFEPRNFRDEWAVTVMNAVQQKIAGNDVSLVPATPKPAIVDLLEALKRSVEANENARVELEAKRDALRLEVGPETVAEVSAVVEKGPKVSKASPRSKSPKKRVTGDAKG